MATPLETDDINLALDTINHDIYLVKGKLQMISGVDAVKQTAKTRLLEGWVYVLTDPMGEVKYVGQTSRCPEKRLQEHINRAQNKNSATYSTHKNCWIRKLLQSGQKPRVIVVSHLNNTSQEELNSCEIYWGNYFTNIGCKLTNTKELGSNGRHSEETLEKLRKPRGPVGPMSEKTKLKLSVANKGKVVKEETRLKMSEAAKKRGVPWSAIRAAQKANKKELCKRGHLLSEENMYTHPKTGKSRCKKCMRINGRKTDKKRRGKRRGAY